MVVLEFLAGLLFSALWGVSGDSPAEDGHDRDNGTEAIPINANNGLELSVDSSPEEIWESLANGSVPGIATQEDLTNVVDVDDLDLF